ncbi:hypothetical protein E2C01_097770 [Portunus trituberculatus]|uniref:Uncharacterized protein n=1 Tax=Portunus trituberculatus TaxID=210409 RepID=A0A5B7K6L0_PORTR|nr:hypothetical protein [Portunus trituberculatus]
MCNFSNFPLFLHQNINATKTRYLSKELKYVKNELFWCIPAFSTPKLRNAGKTLLFV